MDITDLSAPHNLKARQIFENRLNKELDGNAALWTVDETVFVRRKYINPGVQKKWEAYLNMLHMEC